MSDTPRHLDPLAQQILDQLIGKPEAAEIVLGGYFALQHFTDYRTTHDIDAWWRTMASAETETAIHAAMERVASTQGYTLDRRKFGETASFELCRGGRKRFAFQIAVRSTELEPPSLSAWPPILIESLHDNIGGKMNALVERGAPRDFLDIRHIVTAGLATTSTCWALWRRKNPGDPGAPVGGNIGPMNRDAGGAADRVAFGISDRGGRAKVLFHLAALELRRPLDAIADPQERMHAQETREWFRQEFLPTGK